DGRGFGDSARRLFDEYEAALQPPRQRTDDRHGPQNARPGNRGDDGPSAQLAVMIEFEQVCRSYGDKVAVDNLNLRIAAGELYSLLGHNGAGKTTTIKMLVGLLRPERGHVRVAGYDVAADTRSAAALTGYVPDQPYLYDKLSGREFLQFVAQMQG